jgi:hypothetical protein
MRPRIFRNPKPASTILEDEEKHELDVLAAERRQSTSAYIRTIVIDHIRKSKGKKEDRFREND